MWRIFLDKQAEKDLQNIINSPYKKQVKILMEILEKNPFTPPYEKLVGELNGTYSRRINIQHRLVYQVFEKEKSIKIIRMWTHYGE